MGRKKKQEEEDALAEFEGMGMFYGGGHQFEDFRGAGYHDRVVMGPRREEGPPPDPALLAAMTDTRVYTGPECLEGLTKPLTLLVTGKGLMSVRTTPIGVFVSAGDKGYNPLPALPAPEPGVRLRIPRLPWDLLTQTVAWFRHVNDKRRAEALVQFFWDPKAKDGQGDYLAYAPPQDISGGGVHHIGHHDREGEMLHVLDIHSHNTMGAFWSGTDDNDEKRFEGRLFGVIGEVNKAIPAMKWRARIGGTFVDLRLSDVVETPGLVHVHVDKEFDPLELVEIAHGGKSTTNTAFTFSYDPFEGATFPQTWEEAIKPPFRQPPQGMGSPLGEDGLVRVGPGRWMTREAAFRHGWTPTGSSTSNGSTSMGSTPGPLGGGTTSDNTSGSTSGGIRRSSWVVDRLTGTVWFEDSSGILWPSTKTVEQVARIPGSMLAFITGDPPPARVGKPGDYGVR